ncbi:hypothetical protein F4821DRAFT_255769 [Hypoxylon rubiginosum]|uniref:Uncharacterized protein n=1 Tax=Hypoxylon rubiginosum TaxID=110542 RepID=A0ACC0DCZ4_9PEZI|nr:hypothetical protein F4821DRAFT_255769 [Hypoxylon rubiginosum]
MAQGAVKPRKPTATSTARKAKPQQPKKGARVAKAKKGSAADKLQKKYAAGLVHKTEKLLGERAGHLELIGKGRTKDKDGDGKGKSATKGGSRKFDQRRRIVEIRWQGISVELISRLDDHMLQRGAIDYCGGLPLCQCERVLEDRHQLVNFCRK